MHGSSRPEKDPLYPACFCFKGKVWLHVGLRGVLAAPPPLHAFKMHACKGGIAWPYQHMPVMRPCDLEAPF